jgi:hypothetical protein
MFAPSSTFQPLLKGAGARKKAFNPEILVAPLRPAVRYFPHIVPN